MKPTQTVVPSSDTTNDITNVNAVDPFQMHLDDENSIDVNASVIPFLDGCVVSLLAMHPQLERNAAKMIVCAGGTRLSYFHEMATHVVTSASFEDLRQKYPSIVKRRVIVSYNWLKKSFTNQRTLDPIKSVHR